MIRMLKDDVEYGVPYESIKNYKYSSHRLNPMQNTIGNFIILPMELAHCRETYKPIRTHMAKFLCRLERCLCVNGRHQYDRKKWNKEIQKLCFDSIAEKVMKH